MGDGKHHDRMFRLSGALVGVRPASPRLLFFTLRCGADEWRCIAKDRDGYLSAAEVGDLGDSLRDAIGQTVSVVGFAELADDGVWVHCAAAVLGVCEHLQVPLAREGSAASAARGGAADGTIAEPSTDADAPARQPGRSRRSGNRARPRNDGRHALFVKWCVDTFGLDLMRRGVLDVAGGAGGTSFELALRYDVPAVVVDPRPIPEVTTRQRRALRNRAKVRRATAEAGGAAGGGCGDGGGLDGSGDGDGGSASGTTACAVAEPAVAPSLAAAAAEEGLPRGALTLPRQACALFDADFVRENSAVWDRSAVLIGMHPDEATEAVVDLALASGKPFAVVPCCVFATCHPERTLADGVTPVISHEQFCQYLQQKSPRVRRARLERLEGRNVVLYCLPEPAGGPAAAALSAVLCEPCDDADGEN